MASADIATVFLSPDLSLKRCTPRAVELLRIVPTDIGLPIGDLPHGFGMQTLKEDADYVVRTLATIEREVTSNDGLSYLLRLSPYRAIDDRIDGVVLTFVDITQRAHLEEALRVSEEKYRALFNSMDEAYAVVEVMADEEGNWNDFLFLDANPAFMLHTTMPYPVGKTATQLLGPPNPRWAQVYGEVVESGESVRIEDVEPTLGRTFDLNIFRLGEQDSRRVAVLFMDVTQRKRTEAAVLESQQRFQTIANLVPDLLWESEPDGSTNWYNQRWLEYTGQSFEEAVGWGWTDAIHPEDREGSARRYGEAVEAGMPLRQEYRIRRHDSEYHWFVVNALPLKDENGRVVKMYGAATDIHERKRREANLAFLAQTSVDFALLLSAEEIMERVGGRLADYLNLSRCNFSVVNEEAEQIDNFYAWRRDPSLPDLFGPHPISAFLSEEGRSYYMTGQIAVIEDTRNTPLLNPASDMFGELGLGSIVDVPYVEEGRWKFLLTLARSQASEWRADEIELVRELSERIYIRIERALAEEALKDNEERSRLALNAADMGTFLYFFAEDRAETDTRTLALFGLPKDAKINLATALAEIIHPDDRERYAAAMKRASDPEGGGFFNEEVRLYHSDGSLHWIVVTGQSIFEGTPRQAVRMYGVTADITARKEAEDLLRQSEERYRLSIEAAEMATWEWNLRTQEVIWNERHFTLLKLKPRPNLVSSNDFFRYLHPDDADHVGEALQSAIANGTNFAAEFRVILEDGEERWMSGFGRVVAEDHGVPTRMSGVMFDITERHLALTNLRQSAARLRILVESATDYAIFTFNDSLQIDSWNSGAEQIFGYPEAEILGQNPEILFTPEDRAAGEADREIETARQTGRAMDERWHLRKDGSRFYASGVLKGLPYNMGFLKIARDMTPWRELNEELRRAHDDLEIRVQERTAALVEEVAQRRKLEEERERLLKGLVTAQEEERRRLSRELHDQTGQTLTALMLGLKSLPDSDAPGLSKNLVDLTDELTDQVHHLAWELRPAVLDNVGLEAALRQYVREWGQRNNIPADFMSHRLDENTRLSLTLESTLYRVTQEALNNVLRHSKATQVSVLLERRDGEVIAIIEDNGQGFDPEQSTGRLGVVGMRERLEMVGGTLTIESAPGAGTTIYAHVPFLESDE